MSNFKSNQQFAEQTVQNINQEETKTTVSQPTMLDLLERIEDPSLLTVGQVVSGKIIFLAKSECVIDIANIGLGVVRGRELYNEEYISRLKIGEVVEAQVLELDNEINMIELSFRAIGRDKIWQEINQIYESKQTVEAKVREVNRGGFLMKVKGIDGFLPASLLSPSHAIKSVGVEDKTLVNQMKKYLGQTFNVKIIGVNPDADTLVVSERAVSDEVAQSKMQKYQIGNVVEGEVVGVVDFGVFVRFDESLEGLVHISEIAWKKVEDPRQEFKIGQQISAKIIDIDKNNRINLSVKQLSQNPWVEFSKKIKPGDSFKGTVVKIVPYGLIVVNDHDIQGLCHISQISKEPITSPSKIYEHIKLGDTRDFLILNLESDEKLYLTLLDFDTAKTVQENMQNAHAKKMEEKLESRERAAASKKEDENGESKSTTDDSNLEAETITEDKPKKKTTKKTVSQEEAGKEIVNNKEEIEKKTSTKSKSKKTEETATTETPAE